MTNILPFLTVIIITVVAPLDTDFKEEHKSDFYAVDTISKVTKAGDTYTYFYSIKNNGKVAVKVKWSVLSRILNNGQDTEMMWEVEPGENLNFIVEHPDPPERYTDRVQIHSLSSKNDFEKVKQNLPKGVKINIPAAKFYRVDATFVSGVLPQRLSPNFFQRR
jgi:hypothetical protein